MKKIFKRQILKDFKESLGDKPVIILFGARQVGKTTFTQSLFPDDTKKLYISLDSEINRQKIENKSIEELKSFCEGYDVVVFDEAQSVREIGTILKLFADNVPNVQFIATGSSSFELANKLQEPLTGRNRKFYLFPLSLGELLENFDRHVIEDILEEFIIYGSYPSIVLQGDLNKKRIELLDLTKDYLFKDLFFLGGIKYPHKFEKLIQLLALRVGSEIIYDDLSKELGISSDTVQNYVKMLEQSFIVFRLHPFYKNREKEIIKSHKIYFIDNGIRNAVLDSFDNLDLRLDKGALFENFCISEIYKQKYYANSQKEMHFWRARQGGEIDLVISNIIRNKIQAIEFKWKDNVSVAPISFSNIYSDFEFDCINSQNIFKKIQNLFVK